MKRQILLGIILVFGTLWIVAAAEPLTVYVQTEAGFVEISLDDYPLIEGTGRL